MCTYCTYVRTYVCLYYMNCIHSTYVRVCVFCDICIYVRAYIYVSVYPVRTCVYVYIQCIRMHILRMYMYVRVDVPIYVRTYVVAYSEMAQHCSNSLTSCRTSNSSVLSTTTTNLLLITAEQWHLLLSILMTTNQYIFTIEQIFNFIIPIT